MTGLDAVELEVRELVRRRGIDPVTDRAVVRRLVDELVADYDERTLTSTLPPLSDPRAAAKTVYDGVAGFGPLQRHLDDKEVEEIWINEPGRVVVTKHGQSELAHDPRRGSGPRPRREDVRVDRPSSGSQNASGIAAEVLD